MSRSLVVSTFGGLVLVMWLAAWSVVGSAERSPQLETHRDQAKRPVVEAIILP